MPIEAESACQLGRRYGTVTARVRLNLLCYRPAVQKGLHASSLELGQLPTQEFKPKIITVACRLVPDLPRLGR